MRTGGADMPNGPLSAELNGNDTFLNRQAVFSTLRKLKVVRVLFLLEQSTIYDK